MPGFDKDRLRYEYEALEALKTSDIYGVRGRPVTYCLPHNALKTLTNSN